MRRRAPGLHQEVRLTHAGIHRDDAWLAGLLAASPVGLTCLEAVRGLGLPDCWIAAGFVRNQAWDRLHGYGELTPFNDIDVVFFDPGADEAVEQAAEASLRRAVPEQRWQVRNQARTHLRNGHRPYRDTADALAHFVETATSVSARLDEAGRVLICAPLGTEDLLELRLRPGPAYAGRVDAFHERIRNKRWCTVWPRLTIAV